MNLNQLQYFVTLAHMEHYTRAAEKLSITQPSLSHAISSLEEELGTCLFERQGRNVALTKYGRIFMKYAEEALGVLDAGIRKTKALNDEYGGRIDMGYIYTQGVEFVPELVHGFLSRDTGRKIEFGFYNGVTEEILKGIREEKYDIGFCSFKEGQKDLEFTPVSQEKLVAVVPREHELAKRGSVSVEEFLRYPQICFNKGSGLRQVVDKIFKRYRKRPQIIYTVDEDSALAGMVAKGFGVGIVPDVPVIRSMDVAILEIEDLNYRRLIYMVTAKNKYQAPAAREFAEYVKANYSINV